MKTYTREDLINLCEDAIVSEEKWRDRDSYSAQTKIGMAWALLKAGCNFQLLYDGNLRTDEEIIWIEVDAKGFDYFEGWGLVKETFYIPTRERLEKLDGEDWY